MARIYIALLLSCSLTLSGMANHYSGANILYTCTSNNQYEVTLQVFVDCSGAPVVPQTLSFSSSCGTSFTVTDLPIPVGTEVSQLCAAQIGNSTCNGGNLPGMRLYEFTTSQFLPPCDGWTISWNLCCRASSINLIGNQGEYVETVLNNSTAECDNSPVFAEDALPYVCVDQLVSYNFGVSDPDGDSLSYALVDARKFNNGALPVSYQPGFSGAEPIPGITLDATTGQVLFTPTLIGYYIVAVQVDAFNDAGEITGSVVRDILFVVIDCSNNNPDPNSGTITNLSGAAVQDGDFGLALCGGTSFCFDAVISDPDPDQMLTLESNVETVLPGAQFSVSGNNPVTATICWDASGVAPGTFVFAINATDDACPQPALLILSYTIVVSTGPNAGENTSATRCSTDPPLSLFDLLNGNPDPNGTFTEVSPGVYHYVVGAIGNCPADSSVLTLETVQAPDAGLNTSIVVCANGELVFMIDSLLGTPETGGAWISPNGNPNSGIFNPDSDPTGVYCYTVPGTAPCTNATACLSISLLEPNDPACLGLSVPGIEANPIFLFPNPSTGSLTLSFSDGPQRIEVLDAQGRLVEMPRPALRNGTMEINLHSELPNGHYLLRTIGSSAVHVEHFELLR